jgi:hypothetical protein
MGDETQDLTPGRPAIASLADVRPGDLCFTRIGHFVPGVFPVAAGMLAIGERVRIGPIRFDHVLVVTEAAKLVDDGPAGTYIEGPRHDLPRRQRMRGPLGVQAMPEGAEEIEMTEDRHWTEGVAYCRLPESYPGQGLDAARIAREFVAAEVEYSFASYLLLALYRYGVEADALKRKIDRRLDPRRVELPGRGYPISVRLPAEAICSVLGEQAWTLTGKGVITGVAPQAVTPGKLGMQLWRYPGAVWGGPGILG